MDIKGMFIRFYGKNGICKTPVIFILTDCFDIRKEKI